MRFLRAAMLFGVWLILNSNCAVAQVPRVYDPGQRPDDSRYQEPKDLNGFFPFHPPASRIEWQQRSEELKQRVLVATGLWPMPAKSPLKPVIHGLVKRDGFTVEKVYFQSLPGHFVTGLLFRPVGKTGPFPGVLSPHGHGGRMQDYGEKKMKQLLASGAEKFADSGRFPKIARCAQLARMGCNVFIYDMLGYVDSQQISYQVAHRFAKRRPEFERENSWGFYSTQAELRLQSIMGLQTWNSIRALDFLEGLSDTDKTRLAVTGGSGGGTQTILLCAIDKRPIAAFPQGMVSTSMQGGCTCENCSLLRIGTGNVELAALFAPKPQAMTAANDWTKGMMTKGLPPLKQLYQMLGAEDNVQCKPYLHFDHNYNYVTRSDMYTWMNRHLKLGLQEPIVEQDFPALTKEEHAVWNEQHPAPKGGDDYERELIQQLTDISETAIAQVAPTTAESVSEYKRIVGGAIETLIGRRVPQHSDIERTKVKKTQRVGFWEFTDRLRLTGFDEEVPVISLYPAATKWNGHVTLWIDGDGKEGLYDRHGRLKYAVRRLVDAGHAVVGADLFLQGEFLMANQFEPRTRTVKNPREFAGYTHGYNHSLFAQRVHDILTVLAWVKDDDHAPKAIHLVGMNGAGALVAAARAVSGKTIASAAVDTRGFRFTSLQSYRDPEFLPGVVKYGDVPGLLSLSAPLPLWVGGEEQVPDIVRQAYTASGAEQKVVVKNDGMPAEAAVDWILANE